MALETGSYISALVATNPVAGTDYVSQGDDHIRFIKAKLLETFANVTGAVTASHTELNLVTGATGGLATLSVSFASAVSQITVLTSALAGFSLSTSVTSSDITGSIRTPVLQTQAGYTAGTFTAATVVVNNKGIITGISAGTLTGITLSAEQAATSGTAIDFTGIPAGTKRVKVLLNGVSVSGSASLRFQLGDAGGIETTGYLGTVSTSSSDTNFTSGFDLDFASSTSVVYGVLTLDLQDSSDFTWIGTGLFSSPATGAGQRFLSGQKALTAELTQVRVTTTNGTDTFDLGSISISYQS